MKAHITAQDEIATNEIQTKLLKVKQDGLAVGAKAISKVVYDKATDESKSYEDRIHDIITFCATGLAIKTEKEGECK